MGLYYFALQLTVSPAVRILCQSSYLVIYLVFARWFWTRRFVTLYSLAPIAPPLPIFALITQCNLVQIHSANLSTRQYSHIIIDSPMPSHTDITGHNTSVQMLQCYNWIGRTHHKVSLDAVQRSTMGFTSLVFVWVNPSCILPFTGYTVRVTKRGWADWQAYIVNK